MMKWLQKILLVVLVISGSTKFSGATLHTIEANDSQFVQPFDTILVGDTVKWVWVAGNHTTTSNGVPSGALPWNVLLDDHHTSFTYVVSLGGAYGYISVPDAPLMGGEFVAVWPTGISNPSMAVSDFNIIGNPSRSSIQFHFANDQPPSGLSAADGVGDGVVDVSLYNILGTRVQTLYRGTIPPGEFQKVVPLYSDIRAGIYFVTLRMGDAMLTKRVVIQ